jgi:hypothetical protein
VDRDHGLLDISLSSIMVVISTNKQLKSMQIYKKLLISIDMGIAFKHIVHATELHNTPLARENFLSLNLRN